VIGGGIACKCKACSMIMLAITYSKPLRLAKKDIKEVIAML
jgi:hypothetical protein